jgi:DNA-binding HxlR family transcriptional regulator
MGEKYMEYVEKVPKEVRLANESLSGQKEIPWAVVVALIEEGELPFSKLQSALDIHQQKLTNALEALQVGGVVRKKAVDETGGKYAGYYGLTDFGKKILDGFHKSTEAKYESTKAKPEMRSVRNVRGARVSGYNTTVSEVDVAETKRSPPVSSNFNDIDLAEAS